MRKRKLNDNRRIMPKNNNNNNKMCYYQVDDTNSCEKGCEIRGLERHSSSNRRNFHTSLFFDQLIERGLPVVLFRNLHTCQHFVHQLNPRVRMLRSNRANRGETAREEELRRKHAEQHCEPEEGSDADLAVDEI